MINPDERIIHHQPSTLHLGEADDLVINKKVGVDVLAGHVHAEELLVRNQECERGRAGDLLGKEYLILRALANPDRRAGREKVVLKRVLAPLEADVSTELAGLEILLRDGGRQIGPDLQDGGVRHVVNDKPRRAHQDLITGTKRCLLDPFTLDNGPGGCLEVGQDDLARRRNLNRGVLT